VTLKSDSGPLNDVLDRLAGFEPAGAPVLSLYVDARADAEGKPRFDTLLKKELRERARTYRVHTPARESFDRDAERIRTYLAEELVRRANGIALFACAAAGLFEAVQLEVPFEGTRLYVGEVPHLYPLAHVLDEYRRYAALLTDTNWARIFVFGLLRPVDSRERTDRKTRRSTVGGWSQMRYQRHADNFHLQHAKHAAEALERVVREDAVEEVVLAGDDAVLASIRALLPKDVAARVIDVVHLDVRTPVQEVLAATMDAFRRSDARTDAEKVQRVLDEARGNGLGVTGSRDTRAALETGQVDELVIAAAPDAVRPEEGTPREPQTLAEEMLARARQTSARITFVEDTGLLEPIGGVGALLRYRLTAEMAVPPLSPPEGVEA
jgi:peptide subunit release factor 1 (eRF1)